MGGLKKKNQKQFLTWKKRFGIVVSQINNIGYCKPVLIVNNHIYCKAYYVGKRYNNRLILGS